MVELKLSSSIRYLIPDSGIRIPYPSDVSTELRHIFEYFPYFRSKERENAATEQFHHGNIKTTAKAVNVFMIH